LKKFRGDQNSPLLKFCLALYKLAEIAYK
jgi:hypothetical protein